MILTEAHFKQAASIRGQWSRKQTEALGVEWPLERGWKQEIIGKDFHPDDIKTFIALKNAHIKPAEMKRFKQEQYQRKERTRFTRSPKPMLPLVSLDEAIKRLNDDAVYAKVAKSMSWKDELD